MEYICVCCSRPILKDDEKIVIDKDTEKYIHAYCKNKYKK